MSVAYIGGTFDLMHYGHVRLFKAAKDRFETVTVGINRDEFVARFKKRLPILNLDERMEMVAACRYVDSVVVNHGDEDSKPAVLESGATHFVHGSDWDADDLLKQLCFTKDWLRKNNIEMVYFPYTASISSRGIVNRIRNGGLS